MHSHAHSHDQGCDHHRGSSGRRLAWALGLTVTYAGAEAVGGLLANSLALLADAGHMLTDALALALALGAAWLARRPPDARRTYGYQRVEILAALANGVALLVICIHITREAILRFNQPAAVDVPVMFTVAAGGLVVNLLAAWLLHSEQHSLNLRGAYLHVLGDLLGSIGALAAAGLIALYGWTWADPAASVAIVAIIAVSAVRLVLDSVHVLLEGAPVELDPQEVCRQLVDLDGVAEVHDLHLWSLGGGRPLLTAHLVVDPEASEPAIREGQVLRAALDRLHRSFGIDHATLQIEPPDLTAAGPNGQRCGAPSGCGQDLVQSRLEANEARSQ